MADEYREIAENNDNGNSKKKKIIIGVIAAVVIVVVIAVVCSLALGNGEEKYTDTPVSDEATTQLEPGVKTVCLWTVCRMMLQIMLQHHRALTVQTRLQTGRAAARVLQVIQVPPVIPDLQEIQVLPIIRALQAIQDLRKIPAPWVIPVPRIMIQTKTLQGRWTFMSFFLTTAMFQTYFMYMLTENSLKKKEFLQH